MACLEHSGTVARVDAHDKAIGDLWKAVGSIRAWVMAGMGSMVAYFLVVAGDKVFGR